MKFFFRYPDKNQLAAVLAQAKDQSFTYDEQGGTEKDKVSGYDNDLHRVCLGEGPEVWQRAREALNHWQQFPKPWTRIFREGTPLKQNNTVLVLFHLFGIWWVNPSKIVYAFDEPDTYGFAYGTLEGHVEKGEERFWIERKDDGKIYYNIKAFSTPQFWGAKFIYPLARRFQRRFARESMAQMQALTRMEEVQK